MQRSSAKLKRRLRLGWTLAILVTLLGLLPAAGDAAAPAERILAFDSRITVESGGGMLVTETIRVVAAGDQIRRGIYRDFPTSYRDRLGNRTTVDFAVQAISRNGQPDAWHTEKMDNGVRVYVGRKDHFLPHGEHVYTITYRTDRQLGFFKDHDELYWNVTGNGWAFPIDRVSVTVELPPGVPEIKLLEAYTGPEGARGRAYTAAESPEGRAVFKTTQRLAPAEGLTIVVGWPKGYVAEPTTQERAAYFFKDNLALLAAAVGVAIVLGYYLLVWLAVGKDPEKGVVVPLYTPPAQLSPAVMRFVAEMGYDDRVFAAAVIDMAVRGYLRIEEQDGSTTLAKQPGATVKLAADEQKIAAQLFRSGDTIALERKNHSAIGAAKNALKSALALAYEKTHFVTNRKAFVVGMIVSAVAVAASLVLSPDPGTMVFLGIWLSIWSIGVVFLVVTVVHLWAMVFAASKNLGTRAGSLGAALFLTAFATPFVAGEIFALTIMAHSSPATAAQLVVAAILNVLFFHLLKAPTLLGRRVLDQVEGFKMFLSATETDRLQRLYPAGRTPEIYEKFLPYAFALGVEQQWSDQFADVLAAAARPDGSGYRPGWYSGSSWSPSRIGGFATSVGSALSGAISSSSTAPGSRSGGGGGGSSGGGGGGGGGGGW
ncbi:MAG TPA: DUF2207 domain-containing protein [Desulfobacterales bacterium]|nr:DUF2207 domain-containing protein [Desulfobacterales bacterium]